VLHAPGDARLVQPPSSFTPQARGRGITIAIVDAYGGTANTTKQSLVGNDGKNDLIPFPTVEWPAPDPS
jgi:hypothetical protein